VDGVADDTTSRVHGPGAVRVVGIFAHPDDESVCAGGTLARYSSAGADVRVVSLTRGGAGQIRDAAVATRATLPAVRECELRRAGHELGLAETRCLDLEDGTLDRVDPEELVAIATSLLEELQPDVVITFGTDGFSGHPDHAAVGAAVTAACFACRPDRPVRLFHCHRPHNRMLLRNRLAEWVVEMATRFEGTKDFVHALSVFSRETTSLGFAADLVDVEWFPAGTYLVEQGGEATTMYLLLSGRVEIRREDGEGLLHVVDESRAGQFVGEEGVASGRPRNAHVVAIEDVTTLTFSAPGAFGGVRGPGEGGPDHLRTLPSGDRIDARVDTCLDVSAFVDQKMRAVAAHRSQYPIDPDAFPPRILREMFGVEYFLQVLPERELRTSLLADS
jgi:LmbE family N-acetylglucosaminyl deacetylase